MTKDEIMQLFDLLGKAKVDANVGPDDDESGLLVLTIPAQNTIYIQEKK